MTQHESGYLVPVCCLRCRQSRPCARGTTASPSCRSNLSLAAARPGPALGSAVLCSLPEPLSEETFIAAWQGQDPDLRTRPARDRSQSQNVSPASVCWSFDDDRSESAVRSLTTFTTRRMFVPDCMPRACCSIGHCNGTKCSAKFQRTRLSPRNTSNSGLLLAAFGSRRVTTNAFKSKSACEKVPSTTL